MQRVEFYDGVTKVGESATAPFQMDWKTAGLGTHSVSAVAIDMEGATAQSPPVSIVVVPLDGEVPEGDILLVSRRADTETTDLLNHLVSLGIPDGPFTFRSPWLQIAKPEMLGGESIRSFKLILWNDLGNPEDALNDQEVRMMDQLRSSGMPLYLIGEHLAANSTRLTEAASLWRALTQLGPVTEPRAEGPIQFLDPDRDRARFGFEYGTVAEFGYPRSTEPTELLDDEKDIILQRDGRPVMVAGPKFSEPDFGYARVVAQDFLTTAGSDPASISQRRALLLNTASWLMRLGDCDSVGLEVTPAPIPDRIGLGETVRVTTGVLQVGGCDRGAILFSNRISDGFEVVGFGVDVARPSESTNEVRLERTVDGVVARFARTIEPSEFRLFFDLKPLRSGLLTNELAIRFNPYYASLPVAEQVFTVGTSECASSTARVVVQSDPNGGFELKIWGSGICPFQIQTSTDLRSWKATLELTPSAAGTTIPLGPPDTESRFFRVVPK